MKEIWKNVVVFIIEILAGAAMIALIVSQITLLKKEVHISPKETAVIEWEDVKRINRAKATTQRKSRIIVEERDRDASKEKTGE